MISQAFVLGAGLGTRLRPLTLHCPKPLIPVANRPLLTYAFEHLMSVGVERFVVNTHWLAEAYADVFTDAAYQGRAIAFREEKPDILETGGGMKNVADLLCNRSFWVYNGDILATLPLEPALRAHQDSRNEVTLVLRSAGGPLRVTYAEGRILDMRGVLGKEGNCLFTGIYLVQPEFLLRLPAGRIFDIVPVFIDMIRGGAMLGGVVIDEGEWFDLGSREQYLAVHSSFGRKSGMERLANRTGPAPWIDPAAKISPDARITGCSAIGRGAKIGAAARIHDSIVWPGGEVAAGADIEGCVVAGGFVARGRLRQSDIA